MGADDWGDQSGYDATGYLRSLAPLDTVSIVSVKNSFGEFADHNAGSMDAPILD